MGLQPKPAQRLTEAASAAPAPCQQLPIRRDGCGVELGSRDSHHLQQQRGVASGGLTPMCGNQIHAAASHTCCGCHRCTPAAQPGHLLVVQALDAGGVLLHIS